MSSNAPTPVLCALLAGGVACAHVPVCETPPPFAESFAVPAGDLPLSVAAGEVSGDGVPDLVIAGGSAVTVALGDGYGGFTPAPAVETVVHLLALADVNGDGALDLVGTNHDEVGLYVALGDGAGAFHAAAGSPFTALGGPPHNHGLALGDVSGDGHLDAITANQEAESVSVLLGDGTGAFAPAPGSPLAVGGEPYLSRLADLDGDGDLDIVAPLVSADGLAVLLGDGDGGFTAADGAPFPTANRPYATLVADLDGDTYADVLVAHDDAEKVTRFLGSPGGIAANGRALDVGARLFEMAAADLNADGRTDVVGGAGDELVVLTGDPEQASGFCRSALGPLGQAWTAGLVDVDGDGAIDIVAPDATADEVRVWVSGR